MYLSRGRLPTKNESTVCLEFIADQTTPAPTSPDDVKPWADPRHTVQHERVHLPGLTGCTADRSSSEVHPAEMLLGPPTALVQSPCGFSWRKREGRGRRVGEASSASPGESQIGHPLYMDGGPSDRHLRLQAAASEVRRQTRTRSSGRADAVQQYRQGNGLPWKFKQHGDCGQSVSELFRMWQSAWTTWRSRSVTRSFPSTRA